MNVALLTTAKKGQKSDRIISDLEKAKDLFREAVKEANYTMYMQPDLVTVGVRNMYMSDDQKYVCVQLMEVEE